MSTHWYAGTRTVSVFRIRPLVRDAEARESKASEYIAEWEKQVLRKLVGGHHSMLCRSNHHDYKPQHDTAGCCIGAGWALGSM